MLLACVLVGCPTPATVRHVGPDGATSFVEVGTGETTFESLVDGGTIELVHGPQGGYHVWVGCRIDGLDPEGRVLHYVVETTDGALLGETSVALITRRLTPEDGGWLRIGDRVIFGDVTRSSDAAGRAIVLRATLESGDPADGGLTPLATSARTLTIVDLLP